ncbi:MAG: hypothetical protein H0X66_11970 [Verrucomicrobia bacterium]|nr:hypothetical protein [Verrucomicrobiota bacterium]
MRTIGRWLLVHLVGLALLVACPAKGDVNINILGFRYESRSSSQSPSLTLKVRENEGFVSGTWSANLAQSRPSANQQVWFSISIHDARSQKMFSAHADAINYSFLFPQKKSWRGQHQMLTPAGTLVLSGQFSSKTAAGDFTFTPDANYLAQAGAHLTSAPSTLELLELGLAGVTVEQMVAFEKSGMKSSAAEMIRFKSSGVTPQYAVAVRKVQPFSADEIVRLRNSGVPETFPAAMKSAGYDFDAVQLVKLRNSGVSADEAAAWKKAGFDFDLESLVKMRNSGVKPDFARAVKEVFPSISSSEVVKLRNSGISKEFLIDIKKADVDFTVDEIIRLRNSGVSADYIRAWRTAGSTFRSEELIRLRNSGVPVDYAAVVNIPNRKPLSVDTLIKLRNRGMSAQEIRELRE